jgi:ABC-2 type transport system permease protein
LLFVALTMLFVTTVVGWGLIVSAISRTQQQAILFVFILAMVEMTFSGYIVSLDNMPRLLQAISRLAPLQHYLIIVRSIMLKGAGLDELWPQAAALALLCLAIWSVALRSVARRVE